MHIPRSSAAVARSLCLLALLSGCSSSDSGGTRDLSLLVEMTCSAATISEVQLDWDGKVIDDHVWQSLRVDLDAFTDDLTAQSGSHTVGVKIVSQDSSPNSCNIYGLVSSTTGGNNGGSQSIVIPSQNRSMATGAVANVTVTVN